MLGGRWWGVCVCGGGGVFISASAVPHYGSVKTAKQF